MRALILGGAVAIAVGQAARSPVERWRGRDRAVVIPVSRRQLLIAGSLVATVLLSPLAPAMVALAWWTRQRVLAQRASRSLSRSVQRALPEAVDLLILASTAGLALPVAHPLVARGAPAPVGQALQRAHEAAAAGQPRAEALTAHLLPMGDRARALAEVLNDHLRYGVPLLPALERTSLELRLDRRRAAEVEARRVPVRLLAPLVACVLPAFALLTVVPLLAASLEALPT